MNDQIREELSEAANMTSQAYSNIRAGNTGRTCVCVCVCVLYSADSSQPKLFLKYYGHLIYRITF